MAGTDKQSAQVTDVLHRDLSICESLSMGNYTAGIGPLSGMGVRLLHVLIRMMSG